MLSNFSSCFSGDESSSDVPGSATVALCSLHLPAYSVDLSFTSICNIYIHTPLYVPFTYLHTCACTTYMCVYVCVNVLLAYIIFNVLHIYSWQ